MTPTFSIPLRIESPIPLGTVQPVTVGVPFPKGLVRDPGTLCLQDDSGRRLPVQAEALARWSDGSVKWLLAEFLLDGSLAGCTTWRPRLEPCREPVSAGGGATVPMHPPAQITAQVRDVTVSLTDHRGRHMRPECQPVCTESKGAVRSTVASEGEFPRCRGLRCRVREDFFSGHSLIRVRVTLHNAHRARHRGGLWDLGDAGSIFFRGLDVSLDGDPFALAHPRLAAGNRLLWKAEHDQPFAEAPDGDLVIYQDSSGGENWQSRNHVNRHGRVPARFRGYRVTTAGGVCEALRASPVVMLQNETARVSVAVPEFWQQFPKAIRSDARGITVGLFPHEWGDLFELQGGEQKTHTVWLCFEPPGEETTSSLDWVYQPARAVVDPAWCEACRVFPQFLPAEEDPDDRLRTLLKGALRGPESFVAQREVIDEYGWRNYGEVYANHENAYYQGTPPVISHYNNQFDVVYGAIVQMMRTGEAAWAEVFEPLARHVVDVDLYRTSEDRAAFSGGLFWLTDHYLSAETATHRTYSRRNKPDRRAPYGGGPGCEHNYTTGLLHYYYLTGDDDARQAVLSLADWVLAMDDGRQTLWGLLDDGPTGLATATDSPDYHGPGRGAANSINALLDGWLLCGRREYLDRAESLIRRTIHPADDVAARSLLDVEAHWSYTIYLAVLSRYLDLKAEQGERDRMYAYAQSSLVHYGEWMLGHERPYFDHPEDLEYPTEAWAAQEFRKANALRHAARHAEEPLRSQLLARGMELAHRAWSDLLRFHTRGSARAVAVMLVEGMRDAFWRAGVEPAAPRPAAPDDFDSPEAFVPQHARVLARLKTPAGLLHALAVLADPRNWARLAASLRRWRN